MMIVIPPFRSGQGGRRPPRRANRLGDRIVVIGPIGRSAGSSSETAGSSEQVLDAPHPIGREFAATTPRTPGMGLRATKFSGSVLTSASWYPSNRDRFDVGDPRGFPGPVCDHGDASSENDSAAMRMSDLRPSSVFTPPGTVGRGGSRRFLADDAMHRSIGGRDQARNWHHESSPTPHRSPRTDEPGPPEFDAEPARLRDRRGLARPGGGTAARKRRGRPDDRPGRPGRSRGPGIARIFQEEAPGHPGHPPFPGGRSGSGPRGEEDGGDGHPEVSATRERTTSCRHLGLRERDLDPFGRRAAPGPRARSRGLASAPDHRISWIGSGRAASPASWGRGQASGGRLGHPWGRPGVPRGDQTRRERRLMRCARVDRRRAGDRQDFGLADDPRHQRTPRVAFHRPIERRGVWARAWTATLFDQLEAGPPHSESPSRLAHADRGTLAIHEVASLSPASQARLLHALVDGEYQPRGSSTTLRVDVRFVISTRENLPALVEKGKLLRALYERINVMPINLPPLRRRGPDVLRLAEHFLGKFSRDVAGSDLRFGPEAVGFLQRHTWPGNVRELENSVRRVVGLVQGPRSRWRISPAVSRRPVARRIALRLAGCTVASGTTSGP